MKKILTGLMAATMLTTVTMSVATPAVAALNPLTIEQSDNTAGWTKSILAHVEKTGDTIGIKGPWAYYLHDDGTLVTYHLDRLKKYGNKAGEFFMDHVRMTISAEIIADLPSEISNIKTEIIEGISSGSVSAEELRVAQARVAFLEARFNLLDAMQEADYDELYVSSLEAVVQAAHGEYLQLAVDYVGEQMEAASDDRAGSLAETLDAMTGITASYNADTNILDIDTTSLVLMSAEEGVAAAAEALNGVSVNDSGDLVFDAGYGSAVEAELVRLHRGSGAVEIRVNGGASRIIGSSYDDSYSAGEDTGWDNGRDFVIDAVNDVTEPSGVVLSAAADGTITLTVEDDHGVISTATVEGIDITRNADGTASVALATGYGNENDAIEAAANALTGVESSGGILSFLTGYGRQSDDNNEAIATAAGNLNGVSASGGVLSFDTGYGLLSSVDITTDNDQAVDTAVNALDVTGISISSTDGTISLSLASGYGLLSSVDITTDNDDAVATAAGNLTGVSASGGVLSFDTGYGQLSSVTGTQSDITTNGNYSIDLGNGNTIDFAVNVATTDLDASVTPLTGVTATVSGNNVTLAFDTGYGEIASDNAAALITAAGAIDGVSVNDAGHLAFDTGYGDITTDNNQAVADAVNNASAATGITLTASAGSITAAFSNGYGLQAVFTYADAGAAMLAASSEYEGTTPYNSSTDAPTLPNVANNDWNSTNDYGVVVTAYTVGGDVGRVTINTPSSSLYVSTDMAFGTAIRLRDDFEKALTAVVNTAYGDGYEDGYNAGYGDGYADGFADGRATN